MEYDRWVTSGCHSTVEDEAVLISEWSMDGVSEFEPSLYLLPYPDRGGERNRS